MFKLKPGNVFQKINKMDKKQAYTWGAIVIVCFIALITLASFMGDADDTSFDGLNTRGYDLAQMPFINDEAEEYLLASKYPDMQGNNSTMLYTSAEKEARQEEDAAKAAEEGGDGAEADASADGGYAGYSGGGYSGGYAGGGAGSAGPTQVGQLGSASMSRSGGSGVNSSWGAPRGDFSPYKSQEKGSELPVQFKNNDARRALSQFAQTSRAAAGFRDSKGANAKRALMGGNVQGSEAFTDGGVDLSKSGGLALDTNAPVSTADLSNLGKDISDAANKAKDEKDEDEADFAQSMGDRLLEQFLSGIVNAAVDAVGGLLNQGIDAISGAISANKAGTQFANNQAGTLLRKDIQDMNDDERKLFADGLGISVNELPKEGSARDFYREKTGKAVVSKPSLSDDRYKLKPEEVLTVPREDISIETVALGKKTVKLGEGALAASIEIPDQLQIVQRNNGAYKKDLAEYNNGMDADIKAFGKQLKAPLSADTSPVALQYQQTRSEAFNAKQRDHSNKRYSSDSNTFSSSSSNRRSSSGSFKSPNDFTTQTQYEDYVNGLTVDNDVKETLLKRKRN